MYVVSMQAKHAAADCLWDPKGVKDGVTCTYNCTLCMLGVLAGKTPPGMRLPALQRIEYPHLRHRLVSLQADGLHDALSQGHALLLHSTSSLIRLPSAVHSMTERRLAPLTGDQHDVMEWDLG